MENVNKIFKKAAFAGLLATAGCGEKVALDSNGCEISVTKSLLAESCENGYRYTVPGSFIVSATPENLRLAVKYNFNYAIKKFEKRHPNLEVRTAIGPDTDGNFGLTTARKRSFGGILSRYAAKH